MLDLIIRNGRIADGTGAPSFTGDIGIAAGKIERIGDATGIEAEKEWDATGCIVCPGFIDIHSHADFTVIANRNAESMVRQGVTTVVTGNCGHGPAPAPNPELAQGNTIGFNAGWDLDFSWITFGEYLETMFEPGVAINVAPLVPHGTVRLAVMGFDNRLASRREIASMQSLVDEAMRAGAAGLSTGLEYSPGQYADENELVALSEVAARHGGVYASHIRNRGDDFVGAVTEALNIGRRASLPVQLSHLAPRPYAAPGVFDTVLELIHDARDSESLAIGIDTFPDTWGPGPVVALLPPWVYEGPRADVFDRLRSPRTIEKCRPEIDSPDNYLLRLGGFERFFLTYSRSHPELMGKSFAEISAAFGLDYTDTIFRLVLDDGDDFYNVMLRHVYATREDLDELLRQAMCSLGSDGTVAATYGPLENFVMNRSSFGYTVRFLAEYVRDRQVFTWEEAIRKLTSLPADSAGLADRGRLQEGMPADVVVLDAASLVDRSTDDDPQAYPGGISLVVVNGVPVLQEEVHSGALPGQRLPN